MAFQPHVRRMPRSDLQSINPVNYIQNLPSTFRTGVGCSAVSFKFVKNSEDINV